MIAVHCVKCKCELDSYGALIFGVPDVLGRSYKQHICFDCYNDLIYWLYQ